MKKKSVAIYARVSTDKQKVDMQLQEFHDFIKWLHRVKNKTPGFFKKDDQCRAKAAPCPLWKNKKFNKDTTCQRSRHQNKFLIIAECTIYRKAVNTKKALMPVPYYGTLYLS